MSEQSILDHASAPHAEVAGTVGRRLQMLISMVNETAVVLAQRRANKARAAAASSADAQRRTEREQRALYEADRLVWRRTTSPTWWRRATPEQIVRAWEACAPWAGEFPEANAAMQNMATEIRDRFGVEVDSLKMTGGDLALLLGAAAARDSADVAERDTERDGAPALATISYRVRADEQVLGEEIVHLGRGEGAGTARLIATDALGRLAADHPGAVVEVSAGDDPGEGRSLFELDHAAAEEALREHRLRIEGGREADVRAVEHGSGVGAGESGGLDEVAESLRYEQRVHRAQLRETPVEDRDEVAARIAGLGLRLRAVEAEQRGESGDAVLWAAALRAELDEEWWQDATAAEVGALWEHAEHWGPGAGRDQALDHLRDGLRRHHRLEVDRETQPDELRDLLAHGLSGPDRATTRPAEPTARSEPAAADPDTSPAPQAERPDRDAEKEWDRARAGATEQDRAAATVYAEMAESKDPDVAQAGEAGRIVAQNYTAPPSARLDRAAQRAAAGATRPGKGRQVAPAAQPNIDAPSR